MNSDISVEIPEMQQQQQSTSQENNDGGEVAPENHSHKILGVSVVFEIVIMIVLSFVAEYRVYDNEEAATIDISHYYPLFQDVNVMIYIGFGFLMTFLKHYGFGALGYTLIIASMTVQTSLLTNHSMHCLFAMEWKTLYLDITNLITSNFTAGAILVSFGAVIGRVSLSQILVMSLAEAIVFSANESLGVVTLKVVDMGGSIFVHLFGAMFGLGVSYALHDGARMKRMGTYIQSSKTSDTFAMLGTLFLFMFWPSFNGALATGSQKHRVMINTSLSLAAACVIAMNISLWVNRNKLDMVHVQNAVLAGGVAVGSACDLVIQPWAAVLIGSIAGAVSVFGYVYLSPALEKRLGISDTCGVVNLHGVPGLMGAVAGSISAWRAADTEYGHSVEMIWPARNERTPGEQAGYQFLAAVTTIAIACLGGFMTGVVMKRFPSRVQDFTDTEDWKHD